MIIQEIVNVNNIQLKHTYSSNNKYIKQVETGLIYNETYDTLISNFHYIETDKDIEIYEEETEAVDVLNGHTYTESERDIEEAKDDESRMATTK